MVPFLFSPMLSLFSRARITRAWRLVYMGFALCIAILYDVFFWDTARGFGFLVFVLLFVIGFVVLSALSKQLRQPHALLLCIPALVMSVDVVFFNNELVVRWVPLFIFFLLIIFSLLITLQNPHHYPFSFSQIPLLRDIDLLFRKWSLVGKDLWTWEEGKKGKAIKKIAIGFAISVPILFVFGSLFIQADAVFADMARRAFDIDQITGEHVWRLFRTFLITLFLAGFFYVLVGEEHLLGEKKQKAMQLDKTVVGTIVLLVNVLFCLFVFVQFRYLFGSAAYVAENGIVFADYARQGFFQLTWVIGLAALMLIFFYRSAAHHGSHIFLQILKVLLIVQVGVIAYSALQRMNLYQDAYGYTVLRLYVEWFIYFAITILLLAAVSITAQWKFRKFFYISMILGVVALSVVSSVNVDRVIAKENVDRYIVEGKELDMGYLLFHLSIDAAPEVKRAFEHGFIYKGINNDRFDTKENFYRVYTWDFPHLHTRLDEFRLSEFEDANLPDGIRQPWRSFNVGTEKFLEMMRTRN